MKVLRKPPFVASLFCLAPIIFLSYRLYSLAGAPWTAVNSDTALQALMAYHLKPWDLYYWGQDRNGSLVPFLVTVFVKGFGVDAVYMVTWVSYALLVLGWVGFAILLDNPFLAWVLGVFLLVPPPLFSVLVQAGHPYLGQVFFFGLMAAASMHWPAPWVPPTLIALAGGSIWASDFSAVILGVVAAFWVVGRRPLSLFLRFPSLGASIGVCAFLTVAKQTAHAHLTLFFLNSADHFLFLVKRQGQILISFFSIPAYALLLLCGGIATVRLASLPSSFPKKASLVCSLIVVTSYLTVCESYWVWLNLGDTRYLAIVFFFLVLAILFGVAAEIQRGWKTLQYVLLVSSVVLHVYSLIPHARHDGIPSARDTLRPLFASNCTAFIGDYWTAYLVAGMFPDRFLATPHEGSTVRSLRMRDAVLAQEEICLIKEGWLEEFPEQITQFGIVLKKIGSPQQQGRFTVCRYAR